MRENTFTCDACGREFPADQRQEFDGQELCPDCLMQETMTCAVCGDRLWRDSNAGEEQTPLCVSCYDRLYTNCVRCGALIRQDQALYSWSDQDEEEPLCRHCYSRAARTRAIQDYYLSRKGGSVLSDGEMLAICKILLESRALPKEEMDSILDKLLACRAGEDKRGQLREVVANERLYYLEPHHGKPLTEKLWTLAQAILEHRILEVSYRTQTGESKHRCLQPVGLMFSEFYFYLTAFLKDVDRAKEFENPEDPYPTIYRVDRMEEVQVQEERFHVPYGQRFSEGEFRKRIQFMYGGRLRTVRFTYSGPSVEAILDRLPTAKICRERDGMYEIQAEVFGKGIEMWLRSQGSQIVLLDQDKEEAES